MRACRWPIFGEPGSLVRREKLDACQTIWQEEVGDHGNHGGQEALDDQDPTPARQTSTGADCGKATCKKTCSESVLNPR
jgi:hypothetical protein